MPRNYEYLEMKISELVLDDENPRFASSILVQGSGNEVSQESIVEHLLKYADIIKLANRINAVKELHGSELVTCYKRGKNYVVLEGNRRTCACKLLLDRTLIPEALKNSFPFIKEETKENIEQIMVIVYPNRESVQAFLSDRHIAGVKRWSALEKNNYYMNLFNTYNNVEEVKKYTSDALGEVYKCIKKYQFFMDVFNVLKTRGNQIVIEELDYLPMVDRFMETLVGNDSEVGLNLELDEKRIMYKCLEDKRDSYNKILMLVGEAFLIRKEKKYCLGDELSKIVSTEIYSIKNQRSLIIDGVRIPGLFDLINEYKGVIPAGIDCEADKDMKDSYNNNKDNDANSGESQNDSSDSGEDESTEKDDDVDDITEKYTPPVKYQPKKTKVENLYFNQDEAKKFNISSDSDYDLKIRSILFDLSTFSVYKHPYTCALLYRTLLEICTRRAYFVSSKKINKEHNENNLAQSMLHLNNNFLFNGKNGKDIPKVKEAIKNYLTSVDIIQILNLYIHYSNPVDEYLLLSSWNSMKIYVQLCLEI